MKNIISAFLVMFSITLNAQQIIKLNINHKLGSSVFALNQVATNNLNNSFKLTRFQYYLSSVVIVHDGAQNTPATGIYVLVDANSNTSIDLGSFSNITNIEAIKFSVGVNTPENNQDPSLWPASHALSPKSPAMHWGWASGYFFAAIEGKSSSLLNQTLNLHALGNDNFHEQTIIANALIVNSEKVISLDADYSKALKGIDISAGLVLHSSTKANAIMLNNFVTDVFSSTVVSTTKSIEENELNFSVFPNPGNVGMLNVAIKNAPTNAQLKIINLTGKTIYENTINSNIITIPFDNKGIYMASLVNEGVVIATKKVIIY